MRRVWVGLCIVVVLLGATQYALQRAGERALARFIAASAAWGQLQVGSAHFALWGVVTLDDVAIRPAAWLAAFYGLPLGATLHIGQLRASRFMPGWNSGLVLASVRLSARDVETALPDWGWTVPLAQRDGHALRAPTLASLGLSKLRFDVHGVAYLRDGLARPAFVVHTRLPHLAQLGAACRLQVPVGTVADPGAVIVDDCRFDYEDLGLVSRLESLMARRNHISIGALRGALAAQLDRAAARSDWSSASQRAVRTFIHDPRRPLRLHIHPRHPLALNAIPRGLWAGLPRLIGLSATLPDRGSVLRP